MGSPEHQLPTLFMLGDSISVQYGPYLERSLAGRVVYSRKTGDESFLHAGGADPALLANGSNGGDSRAVRAYLALRAESGVPKSDLFLVNCGLHDIKTPPDRRENQISIEEYEENLVSIVGLGRRCAKELVWVSTTPVVDEIHNRPGMQFHRSSTDLADYRLVADRVMRAKGVAMIDLHAFTMSIGPLAGLFCDHVHFREPVRELHGAFISGWVLGHRPR